MINVSALSFSHLGKTIAQSMGQPLDVVVVSCAVSRLPEGVRGKQTAMCHQKMRLVGQEDLQDVWGLL